MLNFLAPQALWLLAALPVVLLLHFIRARRRKEEVSALFLWARARDLATKRRRFSPTWLLLLQLLFVTVLALALAQPSLTLSGAPPRVFIIDASASMAATQPGGTRLEEAQRAAEALLEGAGRVAVVRAGLDATVVQPLSADHAPVRRALRSIDAVDADAALARGVELARALAPDAELHLFSDRALSKGALPAGLAGVVVHPVGQEAPNLGISALELSYRQLFVSVVSNLPYPQEVELTVTRGASETARVPLLVPARGRANTSLPVDGAAGLYHASLAVPGDDALALDDEAFVGSRELRVLLSPPTPVLERALGVIPGLNVRSVGALPPDPQADVLVLAGEAPTPLPTGNLLLFAPPQASPRFERVADWDRSDPLLRFVDLTNVTVGLSREPVPLPEGNARVLAQTGDLSPILLHLRSAEREVVAFRFHPSQTDMVRRPAFPILLANAMAHFRTEVQVPLGVPLGGGRRVSEPGRFEVAGRAYTSSLLSAQESRLEVAARPTESTTESTTEPPRAGEASTRRRDLGLWLVLGALLLLLSEWLLWTGGGGARDRGRGWGLGIGRR